MTARLYCLGLHGASREGGRAGGKGAGREEEG